jgi:competence protein ComEC
MSISGLHITMLAGLAFGFVSFFWRRSPKLMMRLPTRKAATIAGVIVALIYSLVAGFSVPSQRTFYMLLVFALAWWTGRQLVISQVLALALLIVLLIDPWAVSAPGFGLSFGAVAMLAYALGGRIGQIHWFRAALNTQYAVTIGMLPLLLVMFGQASVISPIANAFAIPLISFVVTPLALGSFLPSNVLTDASLHLSYKTLEIGMAAVKWLNQLPLATWQQHEPAAWTFTPAILGVLWLLLPRGFPMRWLGFLGFLPMLLIVPMRPAIGDMKVTVLDVGQGLSVVVQTAKHNLVYDAGPKYNEQSDAGSRIVVPYLHGEGIKKVDGFVVSHNDIDHSGGMASVRRSCLLRGLLVRYQMMQIFQSRKRKYNVLLGKVGHGMACSLKCCIRVQKVMETTRLKIMTVAVCLK